MRFPLCLLAIALGAAPAAAGPRDPLFHWTDAAGSVRYTTERERIPRAQRRDATVVTAERAAQPTADAPAPAPTAPPSASAPAPSPATPPVDAAPPPAPVTPEVAALDAQIAELERLIATDEAALGDYISDPERTKQGASEDVAAIAERMPRLQNELRELRQQREAAASAAPNVSP